MLVDNLPLCLSLVKGRASSRHLLPSCRTASALALAGNFKVSYRWIPSELNPADEPSRLPTAPPDL
eukprot:13435442-Heterocapsa_arctica.AAC.1